MTRYIWNDRKSSHILSFVFVKSHWDYYNALLFIGSRHLVNFLLVFGTPSPFFKECAPFTYCTLALGLLAQRLHQYLTNFFSVVTLKRYDHRVLIFGVENCFSLWYHFSWNKLGRFYSQISRRAHSSKLIQFQSSINLLFFVFNLYMILYMYIYCRKYICIIPNIY